MTLELQERALAIEMLRRGLPLWIAARTVKMTAPSLKYRLSTSGFDFDEIGTVNRSFFWSAKRSDFRFTDTQAERFSSAVEQRVRAVVLESCSVTLEPGDVHPVDAIRYYFEEAPSAVLRELFGMNDKCFVKVCRWLGKQSSGRARAALARKLVSDGPNLDLTLLSARQRLRANTILEEHRAANRTSVETRRSEAAEALWLQLVASIRSAPRKALSFSCRGTYCKDRSGKPEWTWPRTPKFFHKELGAPNGLGYYCKYCSKLRQAERPSRERGVRETANLSAKRTERIVTVLRAIKDEVPTIYLRDMFGLTVKQFARVRVLAKLPPANGVAGTRRVHQWRSMTEEEIPALSVLVASERRALLAAWRKDKKAWEQKLAESEKEVCTLMKQAEEEVERSDETVRKRGRVKCAGGCGKRWYQTKFLFPPTYRRFNGFCRICVNRGIRNGAGSDER